MVQGMKLTGLDEGQRHIKSWTLYYSCISEYVYYINIYIKANI